jgi:hypothetical protein
MTSPTWTSNEAGTVRSLRHAGMWPLPFAALAYADWPRPSHDSVYPSGFEPSRYSHAPFGFALSFQSATRSDTCAETEDPTIAKTPINR